MSATVVVSIKHVRAVMEHAKEAWLKIGPGHRLPDCHRPLTEGEAMALSYLLGVLAMASDLGIDTSGVTLVLGDAHHEPT